MNLVGRLIEGVGVAVFLDGTDFRDVSEGGFREGAHGSWAQTCESSFKCKEKSFSAEEEDVSIGFQFFS